MTDAAALLDGHRFIPIAVIHRVEHAAPLCEALMEGGFGLIEITLRTDVALACISECARRFPGLLVGAGTILSTEHMRRAKDSGAAFGVSPGSSLALLDTAARLDLPFLPGGATPSEFMANADIGYTLQKFFPVVASGGTGVVREMQGPLPDVSFCTTGGITGDNMGAYLSLPNVAAVGGTWFLEPQRMEMGDWSGIRSDARAVLADLP